MEKNQRVIHPNQFLVGKISGFLEGLKGAPGTDYFFNIQLIWIDRIAKAPFLLRNEVRSKSCSEKPLL